MTDVSNCTRCPRLVRYLKQTRVLFPNYHNLPVSAFGDENSQLLIVGLAPGKHGANASGRPFTGDSSGTLLFKMLIRYGFASQSFANQSSANGSPKEMLLNNCRITNAVKCLPPQNKPVASEIKQCNGFLQQEIDAIPAQGIVLALGKIAHNAVLKATQLKQSEYGFSHFAEHQLRPGLRLIDSYHCSRYNIQTRRLTESMFKDVFHRVQERIDHG